MKNKNVQENRNNQPSKKITAIQVLALFLAFLMVAGAATIIISLLASLGHTHIH